MLFCVYLKDLQITQRIENEENSDIRHRIDCCGFM